MKIFYLYQYILLYFSMYISLIYCWISSFSTSKQFFSLKSKFFTKLYQQKSSITKTSSNVIDSPRIYSYQSFILSSEDSEKAILVREDQQNIIDTIKIWRNNKNYDDIQLSLWMQQGLVFQNDDIGISAIQTYEKSSNRFTKTARPPISSQYQNRLYINVNGNKDDLVLVKSTIGESLIHDIKQGRLNVDDFISKGEAFKNISMLFTDERILNRVDNIVFKMQSEFDMTSNEWARWTNQTAKYDATSLTQVVGEYFREQSIGDIGDGIGYTPRAGYPGTLAPGENFMESDPIANLPKRILHPWPALQEIQFHIRLPPSHPLIPNPVHWFALNNMYTDNFTATQLAEPVEEILGGIHMEAKHALKIVRDGRVGLCYDPKDQLPHGGLVFTGGPKIPFYHPDHGPTISAELAKPPIPYELRHLTETWYDPEEDLEAASLKLIGDTIENELTLEDEEDLLEENELRKVAAEKLMANMSSSDWDEKEKQDALMNSADMEKRLLSLSRTRLSNSQDTSDLAMLLKSTSDSNVIEDHETILFNDNMEDLVKVKKDMLNAQRISDALKGKARSQRELIEYTIEIVRDMQNEIIKAERDIATRKKTRRSKRKSGSTSGLSISFDTDSNSGFTSDEF